MKFGIYPGCSLTGSARDYNESVFALAETFGLEFTQIPDWNCCGATAAHNLNKELSLALPARILALAEKNGLDEIIVPCAACYSRLVVTQHELKKDPELKNRICKVIEMDYRGTSVILNVIEWIDKYSGKIGLFGGFDLNLLILSSPDEVYQTVLQRGTIYRSRAKGYGLGSGNSIPGYIPVDGFMAMIAATKEIRRREM